MNRSRSPRQSKKPLLAPQVRKALGLILCTLSGGIVTRFALIRITNLDIDGVLCGRQGRSVPGECYFWQSSNFLGRASMLMHLATILPASVLALLQFIPLLRRRRSTFHRINGYMILTLSVLGVVSGLALSRDAFGGTLELQSAMFLSSGMFFFCLGVAMYNVVHLRIDKHRAWMLRAWAVSFHVITMRLLNKALPSFSSAISHGRFITRSCAVVDHMFRGNASVVEGLYPSCKTFYDGTHLEQHVLIETNITSTRPDHVAANFGVTCASSAWIALALHCIAVEIYLSSTHAETERLRKLSSRRPLERVENVDQVGNQPCWNPAVEKEASIASDSEFAPLSGAP